MIVCDKITLFGIRSGSGIEIEVAVAVRSLFLDRSLIHSYPTQRDLVKVSISLLLVIFVILLSFPFLHRMSGLYVALNGTGPCLKYCFPEM